MSEHSLQINLTNAQALRTPRDLLRIEQEEWGENVGVVTKKNAADFVMSSLFPNLAAQFGGLNCGLDGAGCMQCNLFVYPAYSSLAYTLQVSTGTVYRGATDTLDEEETVIFTAASSVVLKYPVQAIRSYSWQGQIYDAEGNPTTRPVVIIDEDEIKLDKMVSAVLKVKYSVVRHLWVLTVYPRITAAENKYSCTVFGRHEDGISWKEVDPPANADENSENYTTNTGCGWNVGGYSGTTSSSDDSDGYTPPTAPHKDKLDQIDYCSQLPME